MVDSDQDTTDKLNQDAAFVRYWCGQLDAYKEEFEGWEKRCDRISKRYRDDRDEKGDGYNLSPWRFNSLWSNIQTLLPAIYIKAPKPNVERRYLDKDPLARFSSMTLERSLDVTIQECGFHPSMKKAILDYLLCGRGVVWTRYEPTYGTPEDLGPQPSDDEAQNTPAVEREAKGEDGTEEGEPEEAPRPVTWEKSYTDYVNWKNFRHSPSPVWEEVTWLAKRDFLSRKELRTRFTEIDPVTERPIADLVPLQSDTDRKRDAQGRYLKGKRAPKAEVWEIWDKTARQVVFISPQYTQQPLEVTDDPLKLQEFWPCPKPIYATTTNDTLVPVPDYIEYQDQATELDNLTARIKALTDAVRVNGVYDASIPELKRILQEGSDNRLIGVAKWSELSQKGGLDKSVDFLPIKDVVDALIRLYEARDRVKADMAEITGLSDIVRGQSQGSAKTATEQRIKGQFTALRLQDRQAEVARFCRDAVAISAEIIAEQFSPEILAQMTGMVAFIAGEIQTDPKLMAPPMQTGMGHNGGPPMSPPPGPVPPQAAGAMPGGAPPIGPQPPNPEQMALQVFQQAVELLKNDKMRTFRIDIETDSTIEVDRQAAKDSVVELFTAVGGFLEKSAQIGQMVPEMVPALGQSLLFAFRRFGVGRDVEGVWEQAIEQLTNKAKNPPPPQPSPEQIKAQAEQQKQQAESQREAMRFQAEQQAAVEQANRDREQAQFDFGLEQQKGQYELEIERQKLVLKQQETALEFEKMDRQLEFDEAQHKQKLELLTVQKAAAEKKASDAGSNRQN